MSDKPRRPSDAEEPGCCCCCCCRRGKRSRKKKDDSEEGTEMQTTRMVEVYIDGKKSGEVAASRISLDRRSPIPRRIDITADENGFVGYDGKRGRRKVITKSTNVQGRGHRQKEGDEEDVTESTTGSITVTDSPAYTKSTEYSASSHNSAASDSSKPKPSSGKSRDDSKELRSSKSKSSLSARISKTKTDSLYESGISQESPANYDLLSEDLTKNISSLLTDDQWITIVKWIPLRFRLHSVQRVYWAQTDGFLLSNLVRKCGTQNPLVFLIKTLKPKDYVFGCFIPTELVSTPGRFSSTGESFLFTVSPTLQHFTWEPGQDKFFVCLDKDSFSMGGGTDGAGLWFDEELAHGTTNRCMTYCNPPLCGDETTFEIADFEALSFSL